MKLMLLLPVLPAVEPPGRVRSESSILGVGVWPVI